MTTMTITEARAVLADDNAGNNATAAALRTLREAGAELPTSRPIVGGAEPLGGTLYGPDGIDERPWCLGADIDAETRVAAGYVCTVLDEEGWSVSYSADADAVREELYDATVRVFGDGPSADAYHAELVARFSAPDVVEELSEQAVETDGRRQVVPVLAAVAAMWAAFALGQQAGPQAYRPTATSAKAAAVEAQVLRRAVDDADPSDPFEGRVSRPAGTPVSAVPFVEVAS